MANTSRLGRPATLAATAIVIVCVGLCAPLRVSAQVFDPSTLPRADREAIDRFVSTITSRTDLYKYVCKNAFDQNVLRFSRKPLPKPGGRHPDRPAAVQDIVLTTHEGKPFEPQTLEFLRKFVSAHNANVVPAKPSANRPGGEMANGSRTKPMNHSRSPAPKAKNPDQEAYASFAQSISQDYRMSGDLVQETISDRLMASIEKNAAMPELRRAAGYYVNLNRLAAVRVERAKQQREESLRIADIITEKAARGDYFHEETHEYHTSAGWVQKTRRIDDGQLASAWARIMRASAKANTDEVIQQRADKRKQYEVHIARSYAWEELIPKFPERFSGPDSDKPLVEVRLVPRSLNRSTVTEDDIARRQPDHSELFPGKYMVINQADRDLTHVTLMVDFHHVSTLPDTTSRHVYYVPRWRRGEELELSRMLVPNDNVSLRYHVPNSAVHVKTAPDLELLEMAGVVRMTVSVWSNEAKQRPTTIDIKERIDKVVPVLINIAEEVLMGAGYVFEKSSVANSLLGAVLVLPEDSPESQVIQQMLKSPDKAAESIRKQRAQKLLKLCESGQIYTNESTVFSDDDGLGIIFISRDRTGKQVRAELFNPRKPGITRPLVGTVETGRDGLPRITLKPIGPARNTEPPQQLLTFAIPFHVGTRICYWEITETGLSCRCDDRYQGKQYNLDAAKKNDQQLNEARQRFRRISPRDLRDALRK